MSTDHDNPIPPCQFAETQTREQPAPCPQNPAPQEAEAAPGERPPRPPKSALLPEVARLALEGHSGREIGRTLGIPRQTVDRWLLEQRQMWAENAAEITAQLFPATLARLASVYREALEGWRRSLADKQVTVEKSGGKANAKAAPGKAAASMPAGDDAPAAVQRRCAPSRSRVRPPCWARPSRPPGNSTFSRPSTAMPCGKPSPTRATAPDPPWPRNCPT